MGGPACRDSFTRICNLIFPCSLRAGVNVLVWLVAIPHPLREREQSCLSRAAKATNAGVGVTQEHLQSAPQCSRKLFSDTLPLCSRYRFENLSFASFRLNLTSLTSPRPLREREQSCSSRQAKATNAGVGLKTIIHEYPPTVSDHFPLKGGRCLRLQSTSFASPRPLSIQLRKDHSRPMCHVILSPITIQGRRIHKTLKERNSSDSRPQNDGTLASLATPRPLRERVEFQVERERNLEIRVWG